MDEKLPRMKQIPESELLIVPFVPTFHLLQWVRIAPDKQGHSPDISVGQIEHDKVELVSLQP